MEAKVMHRTVILFLVGFLCVNVGCKHPAQKDDEAERAKPDEETVGEPQEDAISSVYLGVRVSEDRDAENPCKERKLSFWMPHAREYLAYRPNGCPYASDYMEDPVSSQGGRVLLPTERFNQFLMIKREDLAGFLRGQRAPTMVFRAPEEEGCSQRWKAREWIDDCQVMFDVAICDNKHHYVKDFCSGELSEIDGKAARTLTSGDAANLSFGEIESSGDVTILRHQVGGEDRNELLVDMPLRAEFANPKLLTVRRTREGSLIILFKTRE